MKKILVSSLLFRPLVITVVCLLGVWLINIHSPNRPEFSGWSQTVNSEGFTTSLTDPLSATTILTPDLLGMYTTITSPLGNLS